MRQAGLETVATEREFTARLHSALGIGAASAGTKAMSLLARIQAGQQITTVDDLYKRMVLSEPETLTTADAVVSHFDELDATKERMITTHKQVRALTPIRGMRERIEESAERLRLIDEIGVFSDPESIASLWRSIDKRLGLLRETERELQRAKREADDVVNEQEALAAAAESERDGLAEVLRGAGGDRRRAGAAPRPSGARRRSRLSAHASMRRSHSSASTSPPLVPSPRFEQEAAAEALDDPDLKRAARAKPMPRRAAPPARSNGRSRHSRRTHDERGTVPTASRRRCTTPGKRSRTRPVWRRRICPSWAS